MNKKTKIVFKNGIKLNVSSKLKAFNVSETESKLHKNLLYYEYEAFISCN